MFNDYIRIKITSFLIPWVILGSEKIMKTGEFSLPWFRKIKEFFETLQNLTLMVGTVSNLRKLQAKFTKMYKNFSWRHCELLI